MQENHLIHLEGTVITDGEKEVIDLTTTGAFYKKNDKFYICYKESSATGFEGSTTTVKIWDTGASITRFGKHHSCLLVEKDTVNICNYPTPAGPILLDISGIELENNLTEKGGNVRFSYTLNTAGVLISENNINIDVKEL